MKLEIRHSWREIILASIMKQTRTDIEKKLWVYPIVFKHMMEQMQLPLIFHVGRIQSVGFLEELSYPIGLYFSWKKELNDFFLARFLVKIVKGRTRLEYAYEISNLNSFIIYYVLDFFSFPSSLMARFFLSQTNHKFYID